jgi:SAM-dependent methyltransferase
MAVCLDRDVTGGVMIDKDKVKNFWDSRADSYRSLPFESIVNLEQDPAALELKVALETAKVFEWLGSLMGLRILDFGAGIGQWTFRFVARKAKQVIAVEYSARLAEIGRREAEVRKLENVEFIVAAAEDYESEKKFDLIFISGLLIYLNDDQIEKFMSNLPKMCHSATRIILRDGTGIFGRHEINDRHSDHLDTNYSAIYRSREEYETLFLNAGFSLLRDEDMFLDSCSLNKYPETRLRLYEFSRIAV